MLVLRQQGALEEVRRRARELGRRHRATFERQRVPDLVQLVEGPAAVSQTFLQMQAMATSEVLLLDRSPMLLGTRNPPELERLRRSVHYRTIYDAELLDIPEYLDWIGEARRSGEAARLLTRVPCKLAIADRSMGLIPLNFRSRA